MTMPERGQGTESEQGCGTYRLFVACVSRRWLHWYVAVTTRRESCNSQSCTQRGMHKDDMLCANVSIRPSCRFKDAMHVEYASTTEVELCLERRLSLLVGLLVVI